MMDAQENTAPRKTARLMISYSRKDTVFVRQFYDCLIANGFSHDDIWVDWEGIPLSADWMVEINKGIQSSDAFIFVISPDSAASDVCRKEIEIAAESNKRFIPILHRDIEKGTPLHENVSSHNWVFIRNQEELDKTIPALVKAINTDLDWLAQHTRLFNRAKEWEQKSHNDSYLIRGPDLQDALNFISEGAAGKEPSPTPLHLEYVQAARKFAATVRRRNRFIAAGVGIALVLLSIFAGIKAFDATRSEGRAIKNLNLAKTQEARAVLGEADANAQRGTAVANEAVARENAKIAEQNAREANSLALASAAINQKSNDTQLALMLALLSIQETKKEDGSVLSESKSALFSSLNVPNVLYTLPKHDAAINAVALDPTGGYIATGTANGQVSIWRVEDGTLVRTLKQDEVIQGMDFNREGTRLGIASSSLDGSRGSAMVWNVETGTEVFALPGHAGTVYDIDFSPDGKHIATASADGTIKLWIADTGSFRITLNNNQNPVLALKFSPDGSLLASGGTDYNAVLWDMDTASLLRTFRGHQRSVVSVAFNPDGTRLITGSYDRNAIVWNVADASILQTLRGNHSTILAVDYAPDGLSMMTAASGVKVWDYFYGTERFNLASHRGEVIESAYSSDGKNILTGSSDRTAKFWANYLFIDTLKMKDNSGRNLDAQYSFDGNSIVTTDERGNILVHDAQNGGVTDKWSINGVLINSASFDPTNAQRIVTGASNGQVNVWKRGSADPVLTIPAHTGAVNATVFSPDGKHILSAGIDGLAKVWNAADGSPESILINENLAAIFDARYSDDGTQIITASNNNIAQTWNAGSGEVLMKFVGHTDFVRAAVFSHDGSRVYTASDDNTIKVWNAADGKQIQNLTGHVGFVNSLDLSPDGELLVSGGADTTVKVWDLAAGRMLYNYLGNNEDTNSVAFSRDGKRVLTASSDETSKEFTIDFDTLLELSQQYELRPLSEEECQRFLYRADCTLTLFE